MKILYFLIFPGIVFGQYTLNGVTTTPTQAIIIYNPGTSSVCSIAVTNVATGATAADVNASLGGDFTGANLDSRSAGTSSLGNNRTFVVGQPLVRGFDSSGIGHVRALQALTQYQGQLTCGSTVEPAFTFTTQNVPVGNTHNNGLAVDRNHPGQYALDTINWTNQNQVIIDPVTGISAQRATVLADTASSSQSFVSAFAGSGWATPSPTGTNTLTGAGSVSNALFLRADGFLITGGPTYTRSTGNSFDWIKISYTGVSSSSSGQSLITCITVNGVNCATSAQNTQAITTSSSSYAVGTGALMDCLQNSGPCPVSSVDVSTVTGTASYVSGTGVLTSATGFPFILKWVAGSLITVNSVVCTIGSVQSELQITLSSCPAVTSGTYPFTANNFGILAWCTGSCVIGPTTYTYGTAPMVQMNPQGAPTYTTSPVVTVGGVKGYYSFVESDLYFYPLSGGKPTPKGQVIWDTSGGLGPANQDCGSEKTYQWDPSITGAMYCGFVYFGGGVYIVRAQLTNDTGLTGTAGTPIPTCPQSGLCMAFTQMSSTDVYSDMVAFNSALSAISFTPGNGPAGPTGIGGIYIGVYFSTQQNYYGGVGAYTLGTDIPRTPAGTDSGSFKIIAAMPSYTQPLCTWCNIHTPFAASSGAPGWITWLADGDGPTTQQYTATLTSTTQLGTSLITCPSNPFSTSSATNPFPANGTNCSSITITSDPVNSVPSTLQHIQVGDVMFIDHNGPTQEMLRVVAMTSTTAMTVQRGYLTTSGGVFNHTGTSLQMVCGSTVQAALFNGDPAGQPMWNFLADPKGTNAGYTTIFPAIYSFGSHGNDYLSYQSYTIQAAGGNLPTAKLCPTGYGYCYAVFPGEYGSAFLANTSAPNAISISPTFAGVLPAISQPNQVDSHAGPAPIGATWVMDARPMQGEATGQNPNACSSTNPFTSVTGFLWKCAATNVSPAMNRKIISTLAYVGRAALVDVSGPSSVIGGTSGDNYKYCIANAVNECVAGSAIGDVYVNAPFVSYPYCYNPNPNDPASQTDDTNMICVGDIGAYTQNITQQGVSTNDVTGATGRALGSAHNIYNQESTFWTSGNVPSGLFSTNWVRWGDQLASALTTNFLPPFPLPDSVNRATFVPVSITMNPPAGITGETVQFWYPELGGCTSRQENCVASSATINQTTPFQWASETITPLSCTGNCTIQVPGISGHVVWVQPQYWASGVKVSTGAVQQVVVP